MLAGINATGAVERIAEGQAQARLGCRSACIRRHALGPQPVVKSIHPVRLREHIGCQKLTICIHVGVQAIALCVQLVQLLPVLPHNEIGGGRESVPPSRRHVAVKGADGSLGYPVAKAIISVARHVLGNFVSNRTEPPLRVVSVLVDAVIGHVAGVVVAEPVRRGGSEGDVIVIGGVLGRFRLGRWQARASRDRLRRAVAKRVVGPAEAQPRLVIHRTPWTGGGVGAGNATERLIAGRTICREIPGIGKAIQRVAIGQQISIGRISRGCGSGRGNRVAVDGAVLAAGEGAQVPEKEGDGNRLGSSVADAMESGRPLYSGPGWLAVTVSAPGDAVVAVNPRLAPLMTDASPWATLSGVLACPRSVGQLCSRCARIQDSADDSLARRIVVMRTRKQRLLPFVVALAGRARHLPSVHRRDTVQRAVLRPHAGRSAHLPAFHARRYRIRRFRPADLQQQLQRHLHSQRGHRARRTVQPPAALLHIVWRLLFHGARARAGRHLQRRRVQRRPAHYRVRCAPGARRTACARLVGRRAHRARQRGRGHCHRSCL